MTQCFAAQYAATQAKAKINEIQKQIGAKKKAKENADELLAQKAEEEKGYNSLVESAKVKEAAMIKKQGTVGNYIHDSVTVNNNEV